MYSVCKLQKWNVVGLWKVSEILSKCGKDMVQTQELHHWDNVRLKWWVIMMLCTLKNDIYLVYKRKTAVATFQIRKQGKVQLFQKLATLPDYSGSGIGTFCLNEIERIGKEAGCLEVICEVYDKSRHAINFYERRGYLVYGTEETLKYTELKMAKKL